MCVILHVVAYILSVNHLHMYTVFVLYVWPTTFSFEGIKSFLT